MYAPAYGYGPGPGAGSANPSPSPSPAFNPNGVPPPPPPQGPHHAQMPGQQPQQHMMYNPQLGLSPHQSPYGAGQQPGMGASAAMGMMQNSGMAHMPGGVPAYQTPYSSSPYGGNMPASSGANLSFMPTTSNAPPFPMSAPNMNPQNMNPQNMNPQNMNPQHQAQRMQPPPSSSTPTQPGARPPPFNNLTQNTPPNAAAQSQFATPQNPNQTHLQTPNSNQAAQANTVITPQTPNFPSGSQGAGAGSNIATPLSPGSEVREKERVTLLLEINRELLLECMRLNSIAESKAQAEAEKNESKSATASPDGADKDEREKEKAEKPPPKNTRDYLTREYMECMRRLQCNLAYLAAIADRSHKPSSQIPPHPAIISAPPRFPKSSQHGQNTPSTSSPPTKKEDPSGSTSDEKKPEQDKKPEEMEEERTLALGDLYKKLQALFPGVDPKKEPPVARTQQQQQQMQAQKQNAGQGGNQSAGASGGDPNAQQKMQNDLLRQKMMQAQQQAQQQQQAQMANR